MKKITLLVDEQWLKAIKKLTQDVYEGETCSWLEVCEVPEDTRPMTINEIETIQDLRVWFKENFEKALVVDCDDEVIVQMGVVADMGGILELKEEEEVSA
jgi:hypothetical protein